MARVGGAKEGREIEREDEVGCKREAATNMGVGGRRVTARRMNRDGRKEGRWEGGVRRLQWCGSRVIWNHSVKWRRRRESEPRGRSVTSVYPCIEQLLHQLTIKKPYLDSYHIMHTPACQWGEVSFKHWLASNNCYSQAWVWGADEGFLVVL